MEVKEKEIGRFNSWRVMRRIDPRDFVKVAETAYLESLLSSVLLVNITSTISSASSHQ